MMPLTEVRPKVLVPVAGLPLLDHIFHRLASAGVDEALLVTMYLEDRVETWARSAGRYGIDISLASQNPCRYGTGAATLTAGPWIGEEPFLMTFGDVLAAEANYPALVGLHRQHPEATIVSAYRQSQVRGGVVVEQGGVLVELDEHPPHPVSDGLTNAGMFVLQPHVFDQLARLQPSPEKNEYEITDVLHGMAQGADPPRVMHVEDYWLNVTGAEEILKVQYRILEEWRQASGGNGVFVDAGAEVSDDARFTPPVRIASRAKVGAASIGPNVAIGDGAVIGDGTTLVECELLEGAQVGSRCSVRYAVVGEGARMADGSCLLGEVHQVKILADGGSHGF